MSLEKQHAAADMEIIECIDLTESPRLKPRRVNSEAALNLKKELDISAFDLDHGRAGKSSVQPPAQKPVSPAHLRQIISTCDAKAVQAVLLRLCELSPALSGAVARGLAPHSKFVQATLLKKSNNKDVKGKARADLDSPHVIKTEAMSRGLFIPQASMRTTQRSIDTYRPSNVNRSAGPSIPDDSNKPATNRSSSYRPPLEPHIKPQVMRKRETEAPLTSVGDDEFDWSIFDIRPSSSPNNSRSDDLSRPEQHTPGAAGARIDHIKAESAGSSPLPIRKGGPPTPAASGRARLSAPEPSNRHVQIESDPRPGGLKCRKCDQYFRAQHNDVPTCRYHFGPADKYHSCCGKVFGAPGCKFKFHSPESGDSADEERVSYPSWSERRVATPHPTIKKPRLV